MKELCSIVRMMFGYFCFLRNAAYDPDISVRNISGHLRIKVWIYRRSGSIDELFSLTKREARLLWIRGRPLFQYLLENRNLRVYTFESFCVFCIDPYKFIFDEDVYRRKVASLLLRLK